MREKILSLFAYLWAGITGVISGLGEAISGIPPNELGVWVSIIATVFTAFVNWLYKRRTLNALKNHPDVKKIYEQIDS
ncbi:phage holin family protein [Grimontia hollisae]|uniref:hypothetical protein n=1 Tax=Grimontia hollisae TaxID=673 RepID=UPI0013037F96|nr:hypothetical protein [Grimontia hollisae]